MGKLLEIYKNILSFVFWPSESRIRSWGLLKCLIVFTMYLYITFHLKGNSIYLKYSHIFLEKKLQLERTWLLGKVQFDPACAEHKALISGVRHG